MPLTPDMRRSIDQIRDYLYGGGYPDPVANAEQFAFLFFFYLVEGIDADNLVKAKVLKQPYTSLYAGDWTLKNPLNAPAKGVTTLPRERFRWSVWAKALSGEALVRFVRDEVFPFFAELGEFRTPRHVIRAIVALIDPKIGETLYDPAAGTAGFLVAAYNHIRLAHSSPAAIQEVEVDGKRQRRGLGDRLNQAQAAALNGATFFGNDVDPKMVRLATMNLTLRGLPNVRILLRNVLTTTLDGERKAELGLPAEGYHISLANPPFSGRVDKDRIVEDVKVGTTTATELLFLKYMMDSLRPGGRCGVIVPEGVLFGSTGAHRELRRQLIENNRVEAVLSLPGGVFQPYSGVKTSVLLFRKGGRTERVMFLHADQDGYKLDANHDTPIPDDDLPGLVDAYRAREACWADWQGRDEKAEWTAKWWFADEAQLRANDFSLSAGRYRPMSQAQVSHREPRELLDELAAIEAEIAEEVEALRAALGEPA